jgi:hypothetical protein
MLVQIGDTKLYSGALNSDYDAILNSVLDPLSNEELAAISDQKWLAVEPLVIDHYIDGRATTEFVVWDSAGEFTFYERQKILITDLDLVPFFAGVLQKAETTKLPGSATAKFHSISAADYTAILEWRLCDYAAENKLAGDAVSEILLEYLAEEGIAAGVIEGGELLTEISIGNKSVAQAYTKLAEACNFVYYIGYDYLLYFHARTLYPAWSILDETDILSETFEISRSNENYRNAETVIGGYEETSLQTELFLGDGTTKTFPLAYAANRFFTVTVNAVNKFIGQKGTDAGAYDCYYAVNSETLTFEVAPGNGLEIEAKYYGLWRAKSKAEDLTAISDNATRQGFGSGKIEHITIDEALTSITAAGEYANAKLNEYARDGIQVAYKTRREGLAAGTLQHIEIQGLDHDFLITHVGEEHLEGDTEYTVEACYGPVVDEWALFFRDSFTAVSAIREFIADESGVSKLYNFSKTYYEAIDRPDPFLKEYPGCLVSSDKWPCFKPEDRTFFVEFWRDGSPFFRKQHTSTPDITDDELFHSYSFISPSEGLGEIEEIVWFGGDSSTIVYGSGVELYRSDFNKIKTILESYQLNMTYINGDI